MSMDYFYDQQIRKYLLQFTRIFAGFQYQTGVNATGGTSFRTVPVSVASSNRQAMSILRNNSENSVISCPQISCFITSIKMVPERRQDPSFVRMVSGIERKIDKNTNEYLSGPGRRFTIESVMPVPYTMNMQVDIWTSNELMKHQLMEQIMVIFNPSIEIQSNVDVFDWSSLVNVTLTDITWTNKTYPVGSDDSIEIASLTFEVPIWLNAPSKLKKQKLIQEILIDITDLNKSLNKDLICHECKDEENKDVYITDDRDLMTRLVVTPGDFQILVNGNEITLLKHGSDHDLEGNKYSWIELLKVYGQFRSNVSKIELKPFDSNIKNNSANVYGVLSLNPEDTNKIFWTIDLSSLKRNTLDPVKAFIDGSKPFPTFPYTPEEGTRYLLVSDIIDTKIWDGFQAYANDIIAYSATGWHVVFNNKHQNDIHYVLNQYTNEQYIWTGDQWQASISGLYEPGYWRLFL